MSLPVPHTHALLDFQMESRSRSQSDKHNRLVRAGPWVAGRGGAGGGRAGEEMSQEIDDGLIRGLEDTISRLAAKVCFGVVGGVACVCVRAHMSHASVSWREAVFVCVCAGERERERERERETRVSAE